jgi:hypothetical protein|tara:strand:- start:10455 stop:10880 length:426 start_codon:yes stop_codon:yes gene_type:complete
MSKETPSQDFHYKFEVVFDKDKETVLQKIKRWINKQKPPFNTILAYLFSYVEKWYWDGKVLQTMANVDTQIEDYHANLDEKKPKPIYRERESEVEGLKEMEIISPYSRRVEGDWLAEDPNSWYYGPLEFFEETQEGTKGET